MVTEHAGPADLAGMQALAQRVWSQTGYRTVGDLAWNYALSYDRPADNPTAVWRDGGVVVAWGWVQRPAELMLQVDRQCPQVADEVLEWAESVATERLIVAAADSESVITDVLRRRGYQPQDGPFFSCLSMSLSHAPNLPALPDGYRIRALTDPGDAGQWVAAHRSAFTGSRFDPDRRRHLAGIPPYRPDTDLVVAAPDGSFAAYCLGWYDQPNKTGQFEPVGASPAHRRRGLAGAVSLAVLRAFRAAGAEHAVVNARGDAAYPAPKRLYESLGFREQTRTRTYGQVMVTDRAKGTGSR
jgi:ribosomal protein S18 acetylase RimI-like enzyme